MQCVISSFVLPRLLLLFPLPRSFDSRFLRASIHSCARVDDDAGSLLLADLEGTRECQDAGAEHGGRETTLS